MEIQVKVIKVLDAQRFVSRKDGSEIIKNTFVGETAGQYPKRIAFTVMGGEKFAGMSIVVGGTYAVSFDVDSREWQGKWFTEASAWKAIRIDGTQPQQTANAPAQVQAPASPVQESTDNGGVGDNLPF